MGHVATHYGARVACSATSDTVSFLPLLVEPGMPFLSFLLVTKGEVLLVYAQKEVKVKANELLLIPPHAKVNTITFDDEYALAYLLLDPTYSDSIEGPNQGSVLDGGKTASRNIYPKLYHLDEMKVHELLGIGRQIESAIMIPHLYMKEIMRSLIYVLKAFVAELDSVEEIVPHDFSHKENVFKIFLHLAATHFREYRQILFSVFRGQRVGIVFLTFEPESRELPVICFKRDISQRRPVAANMLHFISLVFVYADKNNTIF